jgi:hypothetical protein
VQEGPHARASPLVQVLEVREQRAALRDELDAAAAELTLLRPAPGGASPHAAATAGSPQALALTPAAASSPVAGVHAECDDVAELRQRLAEAEARAERAELAAAAALPAERGAQAEPATRQLPGRDERGIAEQRAQLLLLPAADCCAASSATSAAELSGSPTSSRPAHGAAVELSEWGWRRAMGSKALHRNASLSSVR